VRPDGRQDGEMRPCRFTRGFTRAPLGSVLAEAGQTKVLCTVSVEETVPPFLLNTNKGWLTAEYAMLPGSTPGRKPRDRGSRTDARALEIGRLIGRSLRAAVDATRFPGRTVCVDCDVLQADGGTRTTAINGSMVALVDGFREMERRGWLRGRPLATHVGAMSVGIVGGATRVDLDYREDSTAEVDMNVVMTADGRFVEVQGGAERGAFTPAQLDEMLAAAKVALKRVFELQEVALAATPAAPTAPATPTAPPTHGS
jgi:ribonuclease PH